MQTLQGTESGNHMGGGVDRGEPTFSAIDVRLGRLYIPFIVFKQVCLVPRADEGNWGACASSDPVNVEVIVEVIV